MFNPYAESLSSTGEPPTESSADTDAVVATSAQNISSCNESHQETLFLSSSSSRSLSVQEPDSGYEASPSSIAEGISNQRFFGEQASRPSEIRQMNSDDEYDIVGFQFSESESELEEYDTCQDCSSSPVSCSCFRTDSSTTNATANCDNSRCNSSELSFNRPCSQPIQIPNMSSFRLSSDVRSRSPICPLTRSYPMDFSPLGLIPECGLPLSWPCVTRNNCRSIALPASSRSNSSNREHTNINNNRHNFPRHPVRSRRQIIDSDASSYDSSEEDGPPEDDVFNMPSGESSSYPTMMTMSSHAPLPDVVLESTDSGRSRRSMSINLPPDREQQVFHDIGQRLRRMSDLFVQRRQLRMAVMRARSRTASECDDHLHRNGLS